VKPLCVIPARAGSKRLPRKNVALLGGRPLVTWTIEAAQHSGVFDTVLVSTEDDDIAEIAKAAGASTDPRRPAELSGDEVTNVEVCLHVDEQLAAAGKRHEAVICLQPSSPLRSGTDIRDAWARFEATKPDFLVSVTAIDPHYCHWALGRQDDGRFAMLFGDRYLMPRQHLPEFYRPNGAIKIARIDALRERRVFFGPSLEISEMPEERSTHVALPFDLAVCEALLKAS
jgi:CMP-N-acetylneuraminic acid synthetase